MPSPRSSSPIDQLDGSPDPAVVFMGLNLDAFKQLVTFMELADGFTLAIAEVNFSTDGDLIVQALRRHEISQAVNLIEVDFSDRNHYSLYEELCNQLADFKPDPQKPPVLLIRGLATAIGVKGDYTRFLSDLNFRRDVMAAAVPYPMVWFLPDYAVNRLAKNAKDLWTWQSGLFGFRTTQETVVATQTQMRQPTPGQLPDAKNVKQERIEQLERLLSEQNSDRKACIELALELGQTYRGLSDYRQAKRYYRKALHWAEAEQDSFNQAEGLRGLGFIYYFDGENYKALNNYEQALTLYRDVGDRLGEANTLQVVGDVLQFLKRSQEALNNYEQALTLYRDVGARLGE
ncbi:MAG: tetratricopeptide repeat protein, partial [Cyanobacteria bacterium P01_B01_bin.77]